MVVHAVAAGQGPAGLVPLLYEVADDRDLPEAARGEDGRMAWRMRVRHRLREPETPVQRASDEAIVALLRACRSARDRLIVLLLARAGLRRGEVCGLRRGDVHLLVDSRRLGCDVARAHLHVVRRDDNPNRAWAKSRRQRVVPLDFVTVQAFDTYEFERMRVAQAADSDFLLVNLFRAPLGRADAPGRGRGVARPRRRGGPGWTRRSAHTSCGTPTAATSPTPAVASMWSPTCSDTPRCPPRRCMCIPTRPGCGPRWTRCPAPASRLGRPMSAAMNVVAAPAAAGVAAVAPAGGMALHVALHVACEVFVHVFGDGGGEVTSEVYDEVYDAQAARLARMIDPQFLAECGWDPAGRVLAPPADHRQLRSDRAGPAPAAAAGARACRAGARCRAARGRPERTGCAGRTGAASCCVGCRWSSSPPTRPAGLCPRSAAAGGRLPPERHGGRVAYCETHQARWTRDHRADPGLDEARWRRSPRRSW